jgi:hypothetical protein
MQLRGLFLGVNSTPSIDAPVLILSLTLADPSLPLPNAVANS